jgi:hypothetical protein
MVNAMYDGPSGSYGGFGANPPLSAILAPIQHGVFWFNGFLPLQPFVAYSPARISPEDRRQYLDQLNQRLRLMETEKSLVLSPLSNFPDMGKDSKKRFMVTCSLAKARDEGFEKLVPEEGRHVAEFKRQGLVLASYIGSQAMPSWHVFLVFREMSAEAVRQHLRTFPLASYLAFEITELKQM